MLDASSERVEGNRSSVASCRRSQVRRIGIEWRAYRIEWSRSLVGERRLLPPSSSRPGDARWGHKAPDFRPLIAADRNSRLGSRECRHADAGDWKGRSENEARNRRCNACSARDGLDNIALSLRFWHRPSEIARTIVKPAQAGFFFIQCGRRRTLRTTASSIGLNCCASFGWAWRNRASGGDTR